MKFIILPYIFALLFSYGITTPMKGQTPEERIKDTIFQNIESRFKVEGLEWLALLSTDLVEGYFKLLDATDLRSAPFNPDVPGGKAKWKIKELFKKIYYFSEEMVNARLEELQEIEKLSTKHERKNALDAKVIDFLRLLQKYSQLIPINQYLQISSNGPARNEYNKITKLYRELIDENAADDFVELASLMFKYIYNWQNPVELPAKPIEQKIIKEEKYFSKKNVDERLTELEKIKNISNKHTREVAIVRYSTWFLQKIKENWSDIVIDPYGKIDPSTSAGQERKEIELILANMGDLFDTFQEKLEATINNLTKQKQEK